MAEQNKDIPLLSVLWQRFKAFFVEDADTTNLLCVDRKLMYRVRYLERCFHEDCLVEKARKQLERQWQEVSH